MTAGVAGSADGLADGLDLLLDVLAVGSADVFEPFLGLFGRAGGGGGEGSAVVTLAVLLLFLGFGGFRRLELLGGGDLLELASDVEDDGLGFRVGQVQDELAFDVADGGNFNPGGRHATVLGVELAEEAGPAGKIFLLFGVVGVFLKLELHSHEVLSEDADGFFFLLALALLLLLDADELHLASLLVDGGVEFVVDDGGVGLLVVGHEVNGALGSALGKVVEGESDLVLSLGGLAGNGGEGSFEDEVALDSGLVLLAGEGSLEGDHAVDLPGVAA